MSVLIFVNKNKWTDFWTFKRVNEKQKKSTSGDLSFSLLVKIAAVLIKSP